MFCITQLFLDLWNLYVNLFVSKIDSTHFKHSPILWNKCIKSEIMAISFAWTWKSSEFILGLFFPVLPGSSPVGNPSEPYHPELPWDLIGCRSDAAKVVLIMFSSRVATRWSEEGGSNYLNLWHLKQVSESDGQGRRKQWRREVGEIELTVGSKVLMKKPCWGTFIIL